VSRKRKRSIFDIFSEYLEKLDLWAEKMKEEMMEQPSWNCEACTIEPLCNVFVGADEVVVTADLPCVDVDTINVKPLNDDLLEITAKMQRKIYFDDLGVKHRQGEFSMFHCQVHVPVPVRMEYLRTKIKKGILEVHLPRKHVRKIEL